MKHRPCGNGKGDTPRPIQDREKFDSNWDAIFGKKNVTIEEVDHGVYVVEITPKEEKDEGQVQEKQG